MYIYGAGNKGISMLSYLKDGIVDAFIDRNAEKIKEIKGVKVITLDDFLEVSNIDDSILVTIKNYLPVRSLLYAKGYSNVFCVDNIIDNSNFFLPPVCDEINYLKNCHPFNHYESPYPAISDIDKIDYEKTINDIDLNIENQRLLLKTFGDLKLLEWPFDKTEEYRYYSNNIFFSDGSQLGLECMIAHFKPNRIIEIGSGFSTAAMLDVNERLMGNNVEIICIEPRTERLRATLRNTDNIQIYESDLQDVDMSIFYSLEANDILFIDSSHVCKPGSDVSMELFEIIPILKSGVIIHFHDIHWPFEYPKSWMYEGRAYNEAYMLHAFLSNNYDYEIMLYGDMMEKLYPTDSSNELHGCGHASLWIRKK